MTHKQDKRTVKNRVATAVIAIGIVMFGIAIAPGVASAHHPLIAGSTQCRTGDTWSVTWTVRADAVRGFTWQITSPSGYSPSGSQADNLAFTRTVIYPATQASATETVSAKWSNNATGERSSTVQRPPLCSVDTTTTTTTTPDVTTTTLPDVTTTTQPGVTTTTLGSDSSTTTAAPTTTVEQAGPTTTAVGQSGPTSSVDQSSGAAATTSPIAGALPATGAGDGSLNLIVIALTLMGIGAVVLRLTSRPTR
jgi:LPXTG-motif cell wall-anchored protein